MYSSTQAASTPVYYLFRWRVSLFASVIHRDCPSRAILHLRSKSSYHRHKIPPSNSTKTIFDLIRFLYPLDWKVIPTCLHSLLFTEKIEGDFVEQLYTYPHLCLTLTCSSIAEPVFSTAVPHDNVVFHLFWKLPRELYPRKAVKSIILYANVSRRVQSVRPICSTAQRLPLKYTLVLVYRR